MIALVLCLTPGCKHDERATSNAKEEVTVSTETVLNADGSKTVTTTTCTEKDGKRSCARKVTQVPAPPKPNEPTSPAPGPGAKDKVGETVPIPKEEANASDGSITLAVSESDPLNERRVVLSQDGDRIVSRVDLSHVGLLSQTEKRIEAFTQARNAIAEVDKLTLPAPKPGDVSYTVTVKVDGKNIVELTTPTRTGEDPRQRLKALMNAAKHAYDEGIKRARQDGPGGINATTRPRFDTRLARR